MNRKLLIRKEYQFPGSIYFKYIGNLNEDGAIQLQKKAGYHPAGYGFYGFVFCDGIARWNCSNSCD
tara:strand:+ start:645 stop:842 length:198 start_codon:yes stop_codon:yes gene_type:complete